MLFNGGPPITPSDFLADGVPKSEQGTAKPGTAGKASRMDHTHPTISWRGRVTLAADGTSPVTYGRTFSAAPVIQLTAINPSGGTVTLEVITDTIVDGLYVGCTVKGSRAQPLPVMAQVSGLLTAVITGVNGLVTALTGFNVFGGNAAGVVVNVLVIEPSA